MTVPNPNTGANAVKLIGEAFVPGTSQFIDGNVVSGAVHALVGFWARAALGPVGAILVAANSYAKSVTGRNLLKQFSPPAEPSQIIHS